MAKPILMVDVREALVSASDKLNQLQALFDVLRRGLREHDPLQALSALGWEHAESMAETLDDVVRQIDANGVSHD
jgi:hypothetical protein